MLLDRLRQLHGGFPVPKSAFRPEDLSPSLLPRLCLLEALPDGEFRFRLFAAALAAAYGEDLTGRLLRHAVTGEPTDAVHRIYRETVASGQPRVTRTRVRTSSLPMTYDRVICPLADEAGAVRWVLVLLVVVERADHMTVLEAIRSAR
ncbi:MAG TPA: hypothetical protein VED40_00820 [Azospirillaceae bacterium]|nr:hypothetical protein [Azospirillaceae bacterium]